MIQQRANKSTLEQGFTIIELMIATSILSVILVLATVMITSIGRLYYKGVNQTKIQANVRAITDDVTQHLQLSNGVKVGSPTTIPSAYQSYCIGDSRYTYIIDRKLGTDSDTPPTVTSHVLWRDTASSGCQTLDLNNPALVNQSITADNGTELLNSNARLTAFSVSTSAPYTVSVGVAYGDQDLLTPSSGGGINTHCTGDTGQQFCATAVLNTTVLSRLPTGP